jgi:hypothetical protein
MSQATPVHQPRIGPDNCERSEFLIDGVEIE